MHKDLLAYLIKIKQVIVYMYIIIGLLFLLPICSWSQKKQLNPSGKVVKVAFVDHSKLRKDYKSFAAAKEKISKENEVSKKYFEQQLQLLDKQTKDLLKADSLKGGKTRDKIQKDADTKKSDILNAYQSDQKKRNQERITLSQEYEKRIISAMDDVVSKGGYTDVRTTVKDTSSKKGIDITDSILKKLN